jgi:glycogen(starch) synthase
MKKFLPWHKDKFRVVHVGISTPKIKASPLCFSPPIILLLGRLSSEKGFDTAIQAFSLLKNKGSKAELLIAGEGAERPYLEHLVNKLELTNSTKFTGRLSRENNEIYSAIDRATFVVMPSHFEAFGLVALEAMQMKRPVIASNVGGLPEFISNGKTGLLVSSRDPTAFFQAMQNLLENPKKTITMGENARKSVIGKFTIEQNIIEYEALFEKCCQQRSQ